MTKHTIIPQLVDFVLKGKVKYGVQKSVLRSLGMATKDISSKVEKVTRKQEQAECEN